MIWHESLLLLCPVFDVIGDLQFCDVVNLFVLMNNVEVELSFVLNYLKFNLVNIFSIVYI